MTQKSPVFLTSVEDDAVMQNPLGVGKKGFGAVVLPAFDVLQKDTLP